MPRYNLYLSEKQAVVFKDATEKKGFTSLSQTMRHYAMKGLGYDFTIEDKKGDKKENTARLNGNVESKKRNKSKKT